MKKLEKEEKRKREQDEEEIRKTEKFLRRLEKEENKRKRDKDGDDEGDVEIAGCVVPEDPEQKTLIAELEEEDVGEEFGGEEDDDELDPEMVKEGRREEVEFMKEKLETKLLLSGISSSIVC